MVAFREIRIRIVAVPPGEAPEAIRRKWVGLVLPLAAGHLGVAQTATCGVLSDEPSERQQGGYCVEIEEAMTALAVAAPEAERWWRCNTPHLFTEGGTLVFHEGVCEIVDP